MNNTTTENTQSTSNTTTTSGLNEEVIQSLDKQVEEFRDFLLRRSGKNNQGTFLRWFKSLDPSPVWREMMRLTYVTGDYITRGWSSLDFVRKMYRTYRVWYPNHPTFSEVLSHGAVLGMLVTNPTPTSIGLYLIYLSSQLTMTVGTAIESLMGLLGKAINLSISSLTQLIEKMLSWIELAKKNPGHLEGDELEFVPTGDFGQENFVEAVLAMFGTAVATVQGVCLDSLATTLGAGTTAINKIARGCKSSEYLFAKFKSFVDLLIGCIYPDRPMMKLAHTLSELELKIGGKDVGVAEFLEEILLRGTQDKAQEMKVNVEYLRESQHLLDDVKLMYAPMTQDNKLVFGPLIKQLEQVVTMAARQTFVPVRKFDPFHVCFYGEPNVGKSVATHLMIEVMKQYLPKYPKYKFPLDESAQAMSWTENQNFSSGYKGQYIMAMDDICKELKPDENSLSTQLINIKSPIGMNIPGAGVEEKKNPFDTKLLFSTTNTPYPNSQSLNLKCEGAFWRRRDLLVEMLASPHVYDEALHRNVQFRLADPRNPKGAKSIPMSFLSLAQHVVSKFDLYFDKEMKLADLSEWAKRVVPTLEKEEPKCGKHDQGGNTNLFPCTSEFFEPTNDEVKFKSRVDLSAYNPSPRINGQVVDVSLSFDQPRFGIVQKEIIRKARENLEKNAPWMLSDTTVFDKHCAESSAMTNLSNKLKQEGKFQSCALSIDKKCVQAAAMTDWSRKMKTEGKFQSYALFVKQRLEANAGMVPHYVQEESDYFEPTNLIETDFESDGELEDAHGPVIIFSDGIDDYTYELHQTSNPRAVVAMSYMMCNPVQTITLPDCTISLDKCSHEYMRAFNRKYGLDVRAALDYMQVHHVPYDDYEVQYDPVQERSVMYGDEEGSDSIFFQGHEVAWDDRLFPISLYRLNLDLNESPLLQSFEPTGLVDEGTRMRIKCEWWLRSLNKWKLSLGISVVLGALVMGGLYLWFKPKKVSPTYAGTALAHKFGTKHDEFSAFSAARWKSMYMVSFGPYTCSGFMVNGRTMLTVFHTPSMLKGGEEIILGDLKSNIKDFREKFDPKNLEKLGKGSDLALYHFQNKEIPLAPDCRHMFSNRVYKETEEVEILMPMLCEKKMARASGGCSYRCANGDIIAHASTLSVQGQLGKGMSGSIMVVPGRNKIIGVQVAQSATHTRFEHITSDYFDVPDEGEVSATGLEFVSMAEKKITASTVTKYKPSMLTSFFSILFSTTFLPSVLRNNDPRMKEPCDVMEKSMKGYDHPFAELRPTLKKRVVEEMSLEDHIVRRGNRRLMTTHEVINGSTELNVKPLDITTAPGMPWCFEAKEKGKRDFIKGDLPNRYMMPKLLESFEQYDYDKKIVGYACCKDELRPAKKIEEGATRTFIVLPMEFNLKLRQYFGAWIGVQHQLAGHIPSCVGINPYTDWESLYTKLAQYSDEWEDFDYAEWDRTLAPEWFLMYADRVSNWYDDGPENRRIRKALMKQLAYAYVQVGDKIFATFGGNKSGCAITAEINTDIQDMMMFYCWIILAIIHDRTKDSLHEYRRCNAIILYGDDQVKATRFAEWFNGNNIKPLMDELGMKITPADKNGTTFLKKRPEDVTFLKRGFGPREGPGLMMCPLAMPSITKMVHYVHKNDDEHEATKMNVDCAVKEMFFHGKEKYELFLEELKGACRSANLERIPVWKDWETLHNEWVQGNLDPPQYW